MRILSLCGGGTSGYMTARFLERIETTFSIRAIDYFDLIVGTSTGGLIGACLETGKKPSEIVELYKTLHRDLFGNGRSFFMNLFKPKFNTEKLHEICHELFGTFLLSDLPKPFMTVGLQLNNPQLKPKFWKTWDLADHSIRLSDCVIATASAPGGFSPHKIGDKYFYDGGLVANDPTLCALSDAVSFFGTSNNRVLTIQTDYHPGYKDPTSFGGLLSIVTSVPSFCIDGAERTTEYIVNRIFGKKIATYISPKSYYDIDSSNWELMDETVNRTWNDQVQTISSYFREM